MKSSILVVISFLILESCSFGQKSLNVLQRVDVPDSIYIRLEKSYDKNTINVNAGRNVFNLSNRKDFDFKDGIYSFQGQGPHFPRRIFIFNNGNLFIFESDGAFSPKGVIREFESSINLLLLTDKQVVEYAKIIADYLSQEIGNNYGTETKNY